jgi:hypothetical protein
MPGLRLPLLSMRSEDAYMHCATVDRMARSGRREGLRSPEDAKGGMMLDDEEGPQVGATRRHVRRLPQTRPDAGEYPARAMIRIFGEEGLRIFHADDIKGLK